MTSRAWGWGLPLRCLAAFLRPSSPLPYFGGIPLQGWASLVGVILFAPLFFSANLRSTVGHAFERPANLLASIKRRHQKCLAYPLLRRASRHRSGHVARMPSQSSTRIG